MNEHADDPKHSDFSEVISTFVSLPKHSGPALSHQLKVTQSLRRWAGSRLASELLSKADPMHFALWQRAWAGYGPKCLHHKFNQLYIHFFFSFKQISIIRIECWREMGSHLIFDHIFSPLSGTKRTMTLEGFPGARRNKENLY